MKQRVRVVAAVLLLGSSSCSLFFGDRGDEDAVIEVTAAYTESFRRVPEWVRPSVRDFSRSEELRQAVGELERREPLRAAIRLQSLRAQERWGPEVTALHAWALIETGGAAEGRSIALDGFVEHGNEEPSLHYAVAVAAELMGRNVEALTSYELVLESHPAEPVLRRACARTALAAGRADTALAHLQRLPDTVEGSEGLELAQLRAAACFATSRYADAVAEHERVSRAYPDDLALQVSSAAGAFAAAEAAGSQELRERARTLVDALAELDPQHSDAQWMLGRLAAGLGDISAAETALRRTLELDPARMDAGLLLASLLDDSLRQDEARTVLFELMRQPLSAEQVEEVQRRILELERS